jgi:hypothetical protein
MNRRDFLRSSALLTTSALLGTEYSFAERASLKKIGIQLFSLPKLLEKDFKGAIKMLAQMGYREIEMYGPFPFSASEAKESWKAVTPALGFSGSGYFGLTATEVKEVLRENKMTIPSVHSARQKKKSG